MMNCACSASVLRQSPPQNGGITRSAVLTSCKIDRNLVHLLVLNFFVKSIEGNTVSEKDQLVIWAGAVDFVGMVR